jgi:hypothetical protein
MLLYEDLIIINNLYFNLRDLTPKPVNRYNRIS